MINHFLNCPISCENNLQLGAIAVDQNCNSIPKLSQVCDLIIRPTNAPLPDDWTNKYDLEGIIDNTVTDNSKAKWLVGRGGIPEPEEIIVPLLKFNQKRVKNIYELTFSTSILEDLNYSFLKQFQCGWKDFSFWYGTRGGRFFGGPTGIFPSFVVSRMPLLDGEDDTEEGIIIIRWCADGEPERTMIPGFMASPQYNPIVLGEITGQPEAFGPVAGQPEAFQA